MKYLAFILVFFAVSVCSEAQSQIVFNRTEHDFGNISTSQHSFEQDFIFRNTGSGPIKILSVKAVSGALSFVHTRSEVLSKEYGFVKVKLITEENAGLFHDEVYITLKQGDELLSEVLYVRAHISDDGSTQERQFEDGVISTSVEVSPEDIETMEGFMGDDKLKRVESELVYLKKQVSLKDELISKLSSDLYAQAEEKNENLERLAELEKTIQNNGTGGPEAMTQIQELTSRLKSMKSSDSLLRTEIESQEELFAQLQYQADSAKEHALNLSSELQDRFASEAKAIEKAQELQADLDAQKDQEQRQQMHIDSLQTILASAQQSTESTSEEIQRLESELAMKVKEQQMQSEYAEDQQKKIELLKSEKERFAQSTDSLNSYLAETNKSKEELESKLSESSERLGDYESRLDSLNLLVEVSSSQSDSSTTELANLKSKLKSIEENDHQLKEQIELANSELASYREENTRIKQESDSLDLYVRTTQEKNEELLTELEQRTNQASEYLGLIDSLQTIASSALTNSDSTIQELASLKSQIKSLESNDEDLQAQLSSKEEELATLQSEKAFLEQSSDSISIFLKNASVENVALEERLSESSTLLKTYSSQIDSLTIVANERGMDSDSAAAQLAELKGVISSYEQSELTLQNELQTKEERLKTLEDEKAILENSSDSITTFLANAAKENEELQNKLLKSSSLVESYASRIDSISNLAESSKSFTDSSSQAVNEMKAKLASIKEQDSQLRSELETKDSEIERMTEEKDVARKNMRALELASGKQVELAQSLMHKINSLSKKESEARIELTKLQEDFKNSRIKEDSARKAVYNLTLKMMDKQESINTLEGQLEQKDAALADSKDEISEIQSALEAKNNALISADRQADSLRNIIGTTESGSGDLVSEISTLKRQIAKSETNKRELTAEARDLESKLENARLSNEIVFNELKSEVDLIRNERDDYRAKYREAMKELDLLNEALAESRTNEANLKAFVAEMDANPAPTVQKSSTSGVVFRVSFRTSKSRLSTTSFPDISEEVFEFKENEKYRYAAGALIDINSAFALKNKLKAQGYNLAAIVAFRDGKRITLKEALETAAN